MPRRRVISQRQARKLQKRVAELQEQQRGRIASYRNDYPGGVQLQTLTLNELCAARLQVASKLEHALVGRISGNELFIYAVKP